MELFVVGLSDTHLMTGRVVKMSSRQRCFLVARPRRSESPYLNGVRTTAKLVVATGILPEHVSLEGTSLALHNAVRAPSPVQEKRDKSVRFGLQNLLFARRTLRTGTSHNFVVSYLEQTNHSRDIITGVQDVVANQFRVGLTPSQDTAYKQILMGSPNGKFVLEGYPGTGKTTVLVRVLMVFILMGLRVLLVAHSNGAVDAAAMTMVREAMSFGIL